ncbi:helix-turn-helix domain-containing protein [Amycolatopsis rifamycinica]|uniref:AraC family transcriptional regulator n=1 Tax=Amycolatopsis rifamycinica TaxID=287986 RepID=A0A066UC78_9PSEU|nr:helix-turn-helix transcriptional regulator [Amycolatopsis rifamycinica]KDN21838.1 AraC family transcriptional regulator [Amycolatopsis rifamycinica]
MANWTLVLPQRDTVRAPAERRSACPHPRLAGPVLGYVYHDFHRTDALPWRFTPLGLVTVTLDFTAPIRRVVDATHDLPVSPVLGLRDRPLEVVQSGPSRGIAVALTPPGAYALFGMPLRELANTTAGFADLLGREAELLTERLSEHPDPRLLDAFLGARLRDPATPPRPVLGAWHRLLATRGRVRIEDLAEEAGWTRQHLTNRFRAAFGFGPKTVARVVRLQHATSLAGRLPWPEIAHRCGYADQSHLNRDFRAITGCTPTEYAPPEAGNLG